MPSRASVDLDGLKNLILPVRSYLDDVLARLEEQRSLPREGRRATIEASIREQLTNGPTLEHLASRLGLSKSRAGHVVLETTGRTFRQLVEDLRMKRARDLLANTNAKLELVAARSGLKTGPYFARYFKERTGVGGHGKLPVGGQENCP